MTDSFKKREKALEDDYFERQEREAMARLAQSKHKGELISPVSGKPMLKKTIHGVVVDQCPVSGGVWLEIAELEHLLAVMKKEEQTGLERFISGIMSSFKSDK